MTDTLTAFDRPFPLDLTHISVSDSGEKAEGESFQAVSLENIKILTRNYFVRRFILNYFVRMLILRKYGQEIYHASCSFLLT